MHRAKSKVKAKAMGLACVLGTLPLFAGCDLGTITTTSTFDGREAIVQLVRGAVLTPLDVFITNAINEVLGADED